MSSKQRIFTWISQAIYNIRCIWIYTHCLRLVFVYPDRARPLMLRIVRRDPTRSIGTLNCLCNNQDIERFTHAQNTLCYTIFMWRFFNSLTLANADIKGPMKTPEQTVRDKFEQDLNTVSTISKLTESISIPHQVCVLSSVDELLNVVTTTWWLTWLVTLCKAFHCNYTRSAKLCIQITHSEYKFQLLKKIPLKWTFLSWPKTHSWDSHFVYYLWRHSYLICIFDMS